MRHIMVLNAKGGCGKSTLATNIASYFATEGASVALADYDPQRSSLDWLERRPADRAEIVGVAGFEDGLRHCPRSADFVVIDAPARTHAKELTDLVRNAETIVVPVLPSTIDMQATTVFLDELRKVSKVESKQAKFGLVANRVRDNTLPRCEKRRITCAPTRADSASSSCPSISPGPIGTSGSRSRPGSGRSALSPEALLNTLLGAARRHAEYFAHSGRIDLAG